MDKNAQTFYLKIKRNGQWEGSLQSTNCPYLKETAENWLNQRMIEDFAIDFYPAPKVEFNPNKGAFGLDVA